MKHWIISFAAGPPLVLQEVPASVGNLRDENEGDVYVSWRTERAGVVVFIPRWARPGEGTAKRTLYPWHIVTSVEEYGDEDTED